MRPGLLKWLRLVLGVLALLAFLAAFADFRGLVPPSWAHALATVQFGPALLPLVVAGSITVALVAILAATVLFGRVYCSVLCPLGLLQDAVSRVRAWLRPRRRPLPYVRENRWVRYGVLSAVAGVVVLGGAGIAWAHTDPYSIFGRIISGLVRPLVVVANDVVAPAAQAVGIAGWYRVPPPWPGPGILVHPAAAVFTLGLIAALAVWRGRWYCNTLCPVGTVLGFLSRRAAFRFVIDRSACGKCAECIRACKSQCIDLRSATIDGSRCVGCFNCVSACDQHALAYRWTWRRQEAASKPELAAKAARQAPDPGRRAFVSEVAGTLLAASGAAALVNAAEAAEEPRGHENPRHGRSNFRPGAIAPPGAESIDRILARCSACQLCVTACPTHVLQPAFLEYGLEGMMKPRLDYSKAFCNYDCLRCAQVCPTGALMPLSLEQKHVTRIGVAHLELEHCVVKRNGTDCAACSEHCPTKALDTKPYGNNLRLPVLQSDSCIGCGACEYACPASPKAVRVTRERHHGLARPIIEEPPAAPAASSDFPF